MMEAYRLTRKDGASGIDGVTAADYEANLKGEFFWDLLDRINPSLPSAAWLWQNIPKVDGLERTLGIEPSKTRWRNAL